jgi:hypothetical protein
LYFCNQTNKKESMNSQQEGARTSYQMTPEQQAKLKNFGKKNGVSPEKVESQLAIKEPIKQSTVATKLPSKPAPRMQPQSQSQLQQQPQIQEEQEQYSRTPLKKETEDCQTYYRYVDEQAETSFEIDLITFREKGVETRYLSLLFAGVDVRQNPPVPQEAFLNIESKEEFEQLKAFFAQLEWED